MRIGAVTAAAGWRCQHGLAPGRRRPHTAGQFLRQGVLEQARDKGRERKGDSYDNAAAESLIGLYKTELIRRHGPWKGLDDVELDTLEWVDWFNHRRLHSHCGDIPPVEYENAYYSHHNSHHNRPEPIRPGERSLH
jgi:transposase InsO family protein